jgi:hypothetical protein
MSGTTATPFLTTATPVPSRPSEPDDRRVVAWLPLRREVVRRRVSAVAKGIVLAPFVVYAVLVPAAAGIALTNWAFGTRLLALEMLVVGVLMAFTARLIWWVVEVSFKPQLGSGRFQPAARASVLAGFAAVSFTSLTGLLYQQGLVGISHAPAQDRVLDVTFEFYLWHIANTLPLVELPGNLGWHKPFEFEGALGGLLVVGFTGFVILPLLHLARLIVAGGDTPFEAKVVRALGKHVGDDRIAIARDPEGYGRAVIDDWVVVDVMQDVRNHDAVVQRVERLGNQPFVRRARGYLLVVDAVAEGARERVEHALSEAPFEAALAVWRSDQRPADLTAAFDALQERIDDPAPPVLIQHPPLAA